MFSIKTILHASDFSEPAKAAFEAACSLARHYEARLIVLHVIPPVLASYPPPPEELRQAEVDQLNQIQAADTPLSLERRLEEGDPAKEILRVAQESGCDLIVVGTHGRGGIGRLILGSVAEYVVRHAQCPVLTVKTAC